MNQSTITTSACRIELAGRSGAPSVLVLGGISSSRHVTSSTANPSTGWWSAVVGAGLAIDTEQFQVVGVDYIAKTDDQAEFTTHDQARAVIGSLDDAGIDRLHAVIGASYGGMVALAIASLEPERVERLVVVSAAHESSSASTAQRLLQRKVVELGLRSGVATDALVIARALAVTTYSSADDFAIRFCSPIASTRLDDIESYLTNASSVFANHCPPERFLSLSQSLDLHYVDPATIVSPTTLISVQQDALFPPSQMRELAETIAGPCLLELIDSICGHDTFLADPDLIAPIIARALGSSSGNSL